MTRRTLLVPLFAAAFILAPAELSGQMAPSPAPVAGSAALLAALGRLAGWKPALPAPGSPANAGRTGFYRWRVSTCREALGPQGRSV